MPSLTAMPPLLPSNSNPNPNSNSNSKPSPPKSTLSEENPPFIYPFRPLSISQNDFPVGTIQSMQSTSSLRLPIQTLSEDSFIQPPLLSRTSHQDISNPPMWDPSMCQLQRAPDSVQVSNMPNLVDTLTPRMLPLQRADSSQHSLQRKLSGSSLQQRYSDSVMRDDVNVWGAVPTAMRYTDSTQGGNPVVPIRNQVSVGINSEVCFNTNPEGEGLILLPPHYTARSTPEVPITPTATATPLARSLSTEVVTEEAPVLATRVSTDIPLLREESLPLQFQP